MSLFHVMKGDSLLATISTCRPADEMFWLVCDFQPTEAFAHVKPLYDQLAQTSDMEIITAIDMTLIEMGIVLLDVESGMKTRYFSLFFDGGKVVMRFAEETD